MKKDSQLREVIISTLVNHEALPNEVITGFWNTAVAWKDEDLLSDLIRREDLPIPLIEKAKKFSSIKLRTSYLLRSSITETEFTELVSTETRAGVLGGVVDELDIKKFENFDKILITALSTKPTRRLAESVINCESASKELYLQALLSIPNDEQSSDFERNVYKRVTVVAQDEQLYNRLLTNTSYQPRLQRWSSYALTNKGISLENRIVALQLTMIPALKDIEDNRLSSNGSAQNRRIGNLKNVISNVLELDDIQPEVVIELRSIILNYPNLTNEFDEIISSLDPVKLTEKEEARKDLLNEIAQTESMEFIATTLNLGNRAGYRNDVDPDTLFAALNNKHLDEQTELALIRLALDANYEKALEIVKSAPNDARALEVYKHSYHSLIKEDKYQLFSDPKLGRELCIQESFKSNSDDYRSRYSRWNLLEAVVDELDDLDPSLGTVPWEFLVERSSNWYRNQPTTKKVLSYLVHLQHKVLGDNTQKWEALNILSQDFTGSIDDLINTASTI